MVLDVRKNYLGNCYCGILRYYVFLIMVAKSRSCRAKGGQYFVGDGKCGTFEFNEIK